MGCRIHPEYSVYPSTMLPSSASSSPAAAATHGGNEIVIKDALALCGARRTAFANLMCMVCLSEPHVALNNTGSITTGGLTHTMKALFATLRLCGAGQYHPARCSPGMTSAAACSEHLKLQLRFKPLMLLHQFQSVRPQQHSLSLRHTCCCHVQCCLACSITDTIMA